MALVECTKREDHRQDCLNTAYSFKQGAWLKMGVSQGDSKKDILSVNVGYVPLEIWLLFSVCTSSPECTVPPKWSIFLLFISSCLNNHAHTESPFPWQSKFFLVSVLLYHEAQGLCFLFGGLNRINTQLIHIALLKEVIKRKVCNICLGFTAEHPSSCAADPEELLWGKKTTKQKKHTCCE